MLALPQIRKIAVAAALAIFVVGALGGCGDANDASQSGQNSPPPEGTKSFEGLGRKHVDKPVHYSQSPPVGGNHNPLWQNCGFYSEAVHNEHAVHTMEHGAVWIAYGPNLPPGQIGKLEQLAENQTYVLVSPYPGAPSQVVASAWGKQLRLESANDPRLDRFVRAFRQGPQTPEPGAPCTGGTSATASDPLESEGGMNSASS